MHLDVGPGRAGPGWVDCRTGRIGVGVAETRDDVATVAEVMAELAELADPRIREVNAGHGDDHGANLTRLRAVADHPTPPNCTSPYAPVWIAEMVSRQRG